MKLAASPKRQVDVVVAGDPEEMGYAQGSQLRDRIQGGRQILDQLEAFRLMKPAWMPYAIFRSLCERRAGRTLDRAFSRDFPDAKRRLEGVHRGSGVEINTLYLFAAMESMLSEKGSCATAPAFGACSALAVRRRRSATGEPVIVRNFDYLPLVCRTAWRRIPARSGI
jgi:hypothetical protein